MRIQINQTISNIMEEDRTLIRTKTSETYILFPDEGKKLRNKRVFLFRNIFIDFFFERL